MKHQGSASIEAAAGFDDPEFARRIELLKEVAQRAAHAIAVDNRALYDAAWKAGKKLIREQEALDALPFEQLPINEFLPMAQAELLAEAGFEKFGDLAGVTDNDLLAIYGFGRRGVHALKRIMRHELSKRKRQAEPPKTPSVQHEEDYGQVPL